MKKQLKKRKTEEKRAEKLRNCFPEFKQTYRFQELNKNLLAGWFFQSSKNFNGKKGKAQNKYNSNIVQIIIVIII